ncbi:MAG: glycosyltransferase [Actinomycetota bacterium]
MPADTAVVHEWIDARSGSEILFEQLAAEFGDADLYALTSAGDDILELGERTVRTTMLDRTRALPRAVTLPLMPTAWRRLNRPRYDLVVTSTHAFGREFVRRSDGAHCNYVHAPMRYVWSPALDRRGRALGPIGGAARSLARRVDRRSVASVTSFAANSNAVAARIARFYDRPARVIFPPVDVDFFGEAEPETGDYLLAASRWVRYKRLDLAIDVAAALDLPLVIAGWGPEEQALRAHADRRHPGGVTFRVGPSRAELRALMAEAAAFVFPADEDFGIITVEAQAAGTPVVGLAAGGSLDTVADGWSGVLAPDQHPDSLAEAARRCLDKAIPAEQCRDHAANFSTARFRREIRAWTEEVRR